MLLRAPIVIVLLLVVTAVSNRTLAQDWMPTNGPDGSDVRIFEQVGDAILAGSTFGLYRSTDFAGSWSLSLTSADFAEVTAIAGSNELALVGTASRRIAGSNDQGGTWFEITAPFSGQVVSALHNDVDNDALYAITQNVSPDGFLEPGSLWKTTDLGQNWQLLPTPVPVFNRLFVDGQLVLVQGFDPQVNFLTQIYRSFDGGQTWDTPVDATFFVGNDIIAFDGALFMFSETSVRRSDDNGATWSYVQTNGLTGIANSAQPPILRANENSLILAANPSVYRSEDGINWTPGDVGVLGGSLSATRGIATSGDEVLLGGFFGLYKGSKITLSNWSAAHSGYGLTSVTKVAGKTGSPLLASVLNSGIVGRLKGDEPWESARLLDNIFASAKVLSLAQLPGDTALAGTLSEGIFRSTDGGKSWQSANTGVPSYNGTAGLQFHEIEAFAATENFIAAGTGRGLEQLFNGNPGFSTIGGGALRSFDGGASWQPFNAGLPPLPTTPFGELRFDPIISMASQKNVIVAGLFFNGMARSVNGGAWQLSNNGFPTVDGIPAVATALTLAGSEIYAGLEFGGTAMVAKSIDNGNTWQNATGNLPLGIVRDIASLGRAVFVALDAGDSPLTGVWTTNDGAFWQPVGNALSSIRVLSIDAANGNLFAGTNGLGVWRIDRTATVAYGDMNCDGVLSIEDAEAFVAALLDRPAYEQNHSGCDAIAADINGDTVIDGADVGGLVSLLLEN